MPYRDFRETIMPHCSGLFRFFGGLAMQMNGGYRQSYEPAIRILSRREPLGVVACITPFNFPLVLTCSKVAPALAAGNTVVHKPASDTPLTALALAQVALDAGLPEGVYNLVTGPGGSLGDALVKHPLVDKIAFTGSTAVGQNIIRNSAETAEAYNHGTRRQKSEHSLCGCRPRGGCADGVLGDFLEQRRGMRSRLAVACRATGLRRDGRAIGQDGCERRFRRSSRSCHTGGSDCVESRVRQGLAVGRFGQAVGGEAGCGRRSPQNRSQRPVYRAHDFR